MECLRNRAYLPLVTVVGFVILLASCQQPPAPAITEPTPIGPKLEYRLSDGAAIDFTALKNASVPVPGKIGLSGGTLSLHGTHVTGEFIFDLTRVDTAKAERDTNIMNVFFGVTEATENEIATLTINFHSPDLAGFPEKNTAITATLAADLHLRGVTAPLSITVDATADGDTLHLVSTRDVTVSMGRFGLEDAANALMQKCGHLALGRQIPIRFDLTLARQS